MPERVHLSPATVKTRVGVYPENLIVLENSTGMMQSISSLNNSGPFVPNIYRCNPVTIYRTTSKSTPMPSAQFSYRGNGYLASGDVAAAFAANYGMVPKGVALLPTWSPLRAQEAVNKAYAKLMGSDLEVGTMLGEMRETIEGLRNPLAALRAFIKKQRALKAPNFVRESKEMANMLSGSWLEWRYGIRPLISSIQDIYEHLKSQCRDFDDKMHRRGGRVTLAPSITTSSGWMSVGDWQFWCEITTVTEEFYSAKVAYKLNAPLTWQERYGLDIYSAPSIAWELTRLSFVFDWFISVGTWLESLKALSPKVQVYGAAVTQRATRNVTVRLVKTTCRSQPVPCGPSTYELELQFMKRACLPAEFNTVTPALNSRAFDLKRSIDAITLLWQNLPKFRR